MIAKIYLLFFFFLLAARVLCRRFDDIYIYIYIQFFCGDKILDTKKFGGGGFLEGIFHVCGTLRKRAE